jgi:hypothetical protein
MDFENLASSDVFENVCAMLYSPVAIDKQHPALYGGCIYYTGTTVLHIMAIQHCTRATEPDCPSAIE